MTAAIEHATPSSLVVHDKDELVTVKEVIAVLPDRQRWSVMERINTHNACQFFTACRAAVRQRPGPR